MEYPYPNVILVLGRPGEQSGQITETDKDRAVLGAHIAQLIAPRLVIFSGGYIQHPWPRKRRQSDA